MIKILFFAHLREEIVPFINYDRTQCSVQEVIRYVERLYPQVSLSSTMIAVNEQFASSVDIVNTGDVVAFLPPVSGG
ncbi:MAG: MoaD/ThiS family protein [Lysinibacillus sp.]